MFVVSQVDGDGYVLSDAFVEYLKRLFIEDSLKNLVERLAPNCITYFNAHAKSKYKAKIFSSEYSFRNYAINYYVFLILILRTCQNQLDPHKPSTFSFKLVI